MAKVRESECVWCVYVSHVMLNHLSVVACLCKL
jgi:hypothetical protein